MQTVASLGSGACPERYLLKVGRLDIKKDHNGVKRNGFCKGGRGVDVKVQVALLR